MNIGPDDIDPEFTKLELLWLGPTEKNIGRVLFRNIRDRFNETILEIDLLLVNGHFNNPTAKNPHPGVGTLLVYLACQEGLKVGARVLTLYSLLGSVGFYRRIGMHRTGVIVTYPDMPFIAAQPNPAGRPSPIDRKWLNEFNKHWENTRNGGTMVAEIRTVLGYIEHKIFTQWQEVTI
ncbi:hypothetical protein WKW50_24915 [Ochrobactrum sp. GPK 3]|uniref:GNAT family N-acetyltransferase n=1 Tax=Brucella sp. 22210 TaxID=3453892 RepID=UPI00313850B0